MCSSTQNSQLWYIFLAQKQLLSRNLCWSITLHKRQFVQERQSNERSQVPPLWIPTSTSKNTVYKLTSHYYEVQPYHYSHEVRPSHKEEGLAPRNNHVEEVSNYLGVAIQPPPKRYTGKAATHNAPYGIEKLGENSTL